MSKMNERVGNNKIYLLAKEAGLIEFEKFDWNPELGSPTYESVAKARKFAELIVRECANWMDNERDESGDRISDSFYWADRMKKHFGVEE